jgi:purine-nucleoside phosphorylase
MTNQFNSQTTAAKICKLTSLRPALAIVLGSGFKGVLDAVEVEASIPYGRIPGFARATVAGHEGRLVLGRIADLPVAVLAGRAHYYEGHSLARVTFPIRVLAALGVRDLLLTNAAGGINRKFKPGDFMRLTDHLNFMGDNPLRGAVAAGEPRFPDMSAVYDTRLGRWLDRAARRSQVRLHQGVYLAVSGPSYETPAEIRAFARLGADAVGMSTAPEAMVARACGMRVAGVSCITNPAAGRSRKLLDHAEVLEAGRAAGRQAAEWLTECAKLYAKERGETAG